MKKITGELQSGHTKKECLLRQDNFVSDPSSPSFEGRLLAWEASTLPLSYTRPNHIYFSPKNDARKGREFALSKFGSNIGSPLHGYQLCAATEGKSPHSLAISPNAAQTNSVIWGAIYKTLFPTPRLHS